ncbi:MAG: hypothetical protein C4K47_06240 [Candidatus Thorarchaeota archaeon]|nr:MAG: hypothetical protein C4K47_06240 [Candidatus Thorarchaeota archaeon]
MRQTVESESSNSGVVVATEYGLETPQETSVKEPAEEGKLRHNVTAYVKVTAGIAVAVLLPLIPFVTMLGLAVIVLICEIYLIDWVWSKHNQLGRSSSQPVSIEAIRVTRVGKKVEVESAQPRPMDHLKR